MPVQSIGEASTSVSALLVFFVSFSFVTADSAFGSFFFDGSFSEVLFPHEQKAASEKIKTILNKYAEKIDDFDKNINKNLYDKLLILSSYIEDKQSDEIDTFYNDIEKYTKIQKDKKQAKR